MQRNSGKRELILEAATQLFLDRGFHAVGVDTIAEAAGVVKMTLYNHFPSKDALIAAVLEKRSQDVINWLERELVLRGATARDRLLAIFDAHEEWFGKPGFRGCLFSRAASEFPDPNHPARLAAAAHTRAMFELIQGLVDRAGLGGRANLADQILLLIDGATSVAAKSGAVIAARRGKRATAILLEGA